jgi:hypothetical protein
MQKHSYIDESGTKDNQEVMAVALILLDGAFAAQRLHNQLIHELFPQSRKLAKMEHANPRVGLHYIDMNMSQKLTVAGILGGQSIQCFTGCFYHDGQEKSHQQRFEIYTSLIKYCLADALESHVHLDVAIAQQGNWMAYRMPLLSDLNEVVLKSAARLGYRKVKFGMQAASKAGIQLADFYAGATRGHLLSFKDKSLGAPYQLLEHQIREIRIHGGEIPAK